jgi:hypothetical protein
MHASRYQIVFSGRLGVARHEAFRDFHFEPHGMDTARTGDLNRSGLFVSTARFLSPLVAR